jgi:SAM-dependent methyltransferase
VVAGDCLRKHCPGGLVAAIAVPMSEDWSEGYVTEIDYTWGFHKELSPTNLAWVSARRGHTPPAADAPFSYLELGCGTGLSLNVFAAAHPSASFFGADFNPSHIAHGRRTAEQGGIGNVRFLEKSFAELAGDSELPEFDYIVLHGVWSWVSAENRQLITTFLRERLKPGGLAYVSYNALPGWSEMVAVRRMLLDVAGRTQGDLEAKIKAAVRWLQKFWETQNKEAASRRLRTRIERILKSDVAYLAHEYFNKDWTLFFFEDVVQELRGAKLSWLTTATMEQTEPSFILSRSKLALVREVSEPIDREQMRDFLSNAAFRRDVFLKGTPDAALAREPSASPAVQALVVGRRRSHHQFQGEVKVTAGMLRLEAEHERALFDLFEAGPRTVAETFDPLWALGKNNAAAYASLHQMVACDLLRPWARKPAAVPRQASEGYRFPLAFNEQSISDIVNNRARKQLVAAVNAGTGVGVSMREAYLLDGIVAAGVKGAVDHAVKKMESANRRLIIEGTPLQGRKAHEAELGRELERFRNHKLAHFVALGVLAPAR